jgi:hypothetical protein
VAAAEELRALERAREQREKHREELLEHLTTTSAEAVGPALLLEPVTGTRLHHLRQN